jgi:hypothetical protein
LPHDAVGETVVKDYVNPVVLGGTVDQYAMNKTLATIADFEGAPARAGQVETAAFNLEKVEDKKGFGGLAGLGDLAGLRMVSNAEDLSHDPIGGFRPDRVTAQTTDAYNTARAQMAERNKQMTHDLPPLSSNA